MATKNCEKECKELVEILEKGVSEIRLSMTTFLIFFVEFDEGSHNDEKYLKTRAKSYEKLMQRVKNENLSSPKMAEKLRAIYKFLLETDEYKRLKMYKPLVNDDFEREILGDELYEKIKKESEDSIHQ